ncbi:MAG: hypothetical protein HWE39_11600 [Oceanospirillaceae bacterium]|nr:hypothetical protein [Oceanospirillaceae bacterium]
MDIVEILSTGVSGFAFLMLYIGFRLTSRIQNKILDVNLKETDAQKLEIWSGLAERQVVNTRYFMIFALMFLLSGLFVLIYRPNTNVSLRVSPSESVLRSQVFAQGTAVDLDENGLGRIVLKDDQAVEIDNRTLFDEIRKLRTELQTARTGQRLLSEKVTARFSDVGYGFSTGTEQ